MIPTQEAIEHLATRIERAYRLRHPQWNSAGTSPGAWESAASRLCEVLDRDSATPIDPELFVAVQPCGGLRRDPWSELTQHQSLRRYLKVVRKIVGQLRVELRDEVRRAERSMLRGVSLDRLLANEGTRLSPLARYILAHRAGRMDLSDRHRPAAESQHRSCPLYELASRKFLPGSAYPSPRYQDAEPEAAWALPVFSVN